jgi:hypothetical protein
VLGEAQLKKIVDSISGVLDLGKNKDMEVKNVV